MSLIKRDYVDAKLFAATDVYYFEIDNRPLWEMLKNEAACADELEDILDSYEEVFTAIVESPSIETAVGGRFQCLLGGTVSRVVVSHGAPAAADSYVVDVNINGTTCFTTQGNRPSLAFDDGDGVTAVVEGVIENKTVPANGILTVDIDAVQTGGSPRWLRVDVFIRKNITRRDADDYVVSGDPAEVTYAP